MDFSQLLPRDCTKSAVPCTSKKRAFEIISELAAGHLGLSAQVVFDALWQREKQGSTALGAGIAMPCARLDEGLMPMAVLVHFADPIAFDASDNQPVDLLCALLVPAAESKRHLSTLSQLAAKLNDKAVCRQLRQAQSDDQLYQIMTHFSTPPPVLGAAIS
ncbi:MAG: PTS IIA-like nitrogen regulatory protein PtsN [Aeromonas sp.]